MVVPLGVFGAILATLWRGLSKDVFFQVGLLTTIGLSAKNAILIVEFAKENYDSGEELLDATVRAAHQRLRPILMTSLAFVFGVLPLAISTGAGSGGQNAIGTGVIGGMIAATVLAIFFVPLFFVVMLRLFKVPRHSERFATPGDPPAAPPDAPPGDAPRGPDRRTATTPPPAPVAATTGSRPSLPRPQTARLPR
jgi:multidrug efflux pump